MPSTTAPVLFIDVDDTLVRTVGPKRLPMMSMLDLVRALHAHGAQLFLWSRGGAAYALATARELGVEQCFVAFLPKPHALLDDTPTHAWRLPELHPAQCTGLSAEELLAHLA